MGTRIHCDLLFKKLTLILSFLKYVTECVFTEGAWFDVYPTIFVFLFINSPNYACVKNKSKTLAFPIASN